MPGCQHTHQSNYIVKPLRVGGFPEVFCFSHLIYRIWDFPDSLLHVYLLIHVFQIILCLAIWAVAEELIDMGCVSAKESKKEKVVDTTQAAASAPAVAGAAAQSDAPKPMPPQFMSQTHHALRALLKNLAGAADLAIFDSNWSDYKRLEQLHMTLEENAFFPLLSAIQADCHKLAHEEHEEDQ